MLAKFSQAKMKWATIIACIGPRAKRAAEPSEPSRGLERERERASGETTHVSRDPEREKWARVTRASYTGEK